MSHQGVPAARRRRAGGPASLLAVVVMVLATGCGSGAKPAATAPVPRPLTSDQAAQLASTLYRDYQGRGAIIDANVVYSPTVVVGIQGAVDFQGHAGHLDVQTTTQGQGTSTQSVDYTSTAVYEAEPASTLPGGVGWSERAPDPEGHPLDRVIQLIVALASPQRDNPLLVQQSQARWISRQTFDEVPVNVYRYDPSITYLVGVDDGLLYRFVGTVSGFGGPVTIDVQSRGPQSVPPPPAAAIVPASPGAGGTPGG